MPPAQARNARVHADNAEPTQLFHIIIPKESVFGCDQPHKKHSTCLLHWAVWKLSIRQAVMGSSATMEKHTYIQWVTCEAAPHTPNIPHTYQVRRCLGGTTQCPRPLHGPTILLCFSWAIQPLETSRASNQSSSINKTGGRALRFSAACVLTRACACVAASAITSLFSPRDLRTQTQLRVFPHARNSSALGHNAA